MRILVLFIVFFALNSQAQTLAPTNLNLNAGGVIHDVAYDSYYDAYVVVGEFTSINNQPRQNLAFIDATTLSVMSQAPITGINGAIRSVQVVNDISHSSPTLGNGLRHYIYLGGNFTSINTSTKVAVARLLTTYYPASPPMGGLGNYALQTTWDAELWWDTSFGTEYGVHDFHLMGDTLIAVGELNNLFASYLTGNYNRKTISFDADHPTFLTKDLVFLNGAIDFDVSIDQPLFGIEQLGDRLFLYGTASNVEIINEYQLDGTFVQQIENCSTSNSAVYDFEPHPSSVDTMLFSYEGANYASSPYYITSYQNDGTLWNCPGVSLSNPMLDFPTMGLVNYVESYKDFVFTAGANTNKLFVTKRNGTANVPVLNSFNLNNNWYLNYPNPNGAPCLKRQNNLLFFSTNALTSVDANTRTGLAVFCLEPAPAEPFSVSDPTACEEDSSIFTIPQTQCAHGYRWSYSGTGAMYRVTGSGSAWAPLTSVELLGTNTNSIEVYYPLGTTSGTLSVEPFSVFSATDNHYSQAQTIAITINQKPDIALAPVHTLNCYSDSTVLSVQTTNPNPQFLWSYNNNQNFIANDSLLITINDIPLFDSIYYHMQITDALTGCVNTDSTFFYQDLVAEQIDTSLVSTTPNQWTCLTDSMILSANQTGYLIQWEDPAGSFFADPLIIYSQPSAYYNIHGIQLSNGCTTQKPFGGIGVNTTQAVGTLIGYNYVDGGTPIDTLTCDQPSITIQCGVTAPFSQNSSAQWLDTSGVSTGSDILTLSEQDANGASFIVRQFQTYNSDNGCTEIYNVQVRCNFVQPFVPTLANQTINCSQSQILLTHPVNGSQNLTEGWLDGSTQTGSDTLTVYGAGEYYYQVISDTNGCYSIDTVLVVQTLDLLIDMPSDTLICPNQTVVIAPIVIGNSETPSYLWLGGSTAATHSATGGVDSELIVTISTPSGCLATDTTTISITPPVVTTVQAIAGCTDGSLQVISSTGGAGNYQYSLDGNNWQTSLNFPSLSFGNYTIYTQDDLGCVYSTTQSLDGTASSVEMNFVASTYNEQGDTILLVNTTDFTGLDSVLWNYPPSANVIFENDSLSLLSMSVEGWYDVELIGYMGASCEYSFSKPVYFGGQSPMFNDSLEFNGIDSVNIFPNPIVNAGTFTVYVEFGKTQNYTIVVTNNLGQPVPSMSVSGVGEMISQPFSFPLGTASGFYRVHIIGDYDARQIQITLN